MSSKVLEELKKVNPIIENGKRRRKHHQHLTQEIGIPHLQQHLTKLITLMQLSDGIEDFKDNFQKVFRKAKQLKLNLDEQ